MPNDAQPNTATAPAPEVTWELDGQTYPLYAFDAPQIVELPGGTKHRFKLWSEVTEKKREDLLKTVVVTSPHMLNGENPRDVKTDYTRSNIKYYDMMIEAVSGMILDGHSPDEWLSVGMEVEPGHTLIEYIGAPLKKAAASRLYSGKIELEKVDTEETDDTDYSDPFAEEETAEIGEQLAKADKQKELYRLTLNRSHIIRQSLGIETVAGRASAPKRVARYHFHEPSGDDFSIWELKGYRGFSVPLQKGGEKSERYYNLETVKRLFDRLIDEVEGASIGGQPIILPEQRDDPARVALLAKIPLSIKKWTVATLFSEMSNLGNF